MTSRGKPIIALLVVCGESWSYATTKDSGIYMGLIGQLSHAKMENDSGFQVYYVHVYVSKYLEEHIFPGLKIQDSEMLARVLTWVLCSFTQSSYKQNDKINIYLTRTTRKHMFNTKYLIKKQSAIFLEITWLLQFIRFPLHRVDSFHFVADLIFSICFS